MPQHRSIEARIRDRWAEFSPQERRAAEAVLAHLEDLPLYSSAELAEIAQVSPSTMSRFYRTLGYQSFAQVREHARALRAQGVPVDTRPTAAGPSTPAQRLLGSSARVASVEQLLSALTWARLVQGLAEAETVRIVGGRNSHAVAAHLHHQLLQCRPDVRLLPVPGQSLAENLVGIGPQDLTLWIGFRRRPRGFRAALEHDAAGSGTTALLADPSAQDLAALADLALECPIQGEGPFDDYAAPMALCALLADDVLRALGAGGRARIEEITASYAVLGELED